MKKKQLYSAFLLAAAGVTGLSVFPIGRFQPKTEGIPTALKENYTRVELGGGVFYRFYGLPPEIRQKVQYDFCEKDLPFLSRAITQAQINPAFPETKEKSSFQLPPSIKDEKDVVLHNQEVVTSLPSEESPVFFICSQPAPQALNHSVAQEVFSAWLACQLKQIHEYEFNARVLHRIDKSFAPLEQAFQKGYERARNNTALHFSFREKPQRIIQSIRCVYPSIR